MSLVAIRDHLKQHRQPVSLVDLAKTFDVEPDLMRDMLGHWIRKKTVQLIKPTMLCAKACTQCDPDCQEYYFWRR